MRRHTSGREDDTDAHAAYPRLILVDAAANGMMLQRKMQLAASNAMRRTVKLL
jgi:hypothetical protein